MKEEDQEQLQFNSAKSFSIYIETFAVEKKMSHIDAIVEYCSKNFVDLEDISKLINNSLKQKLKVEFEDMNYMKKPAGFKI